MLAVSVTAARSESAAVHSSAVVDEASGDAIVGAASTYNPFKPGWREGGPSTASGERYDPDCWSAAIKTDLREKFGGVQFGARPKYALVEAVGKKVIVKINDVGPLTPGRIIDLNERTMRHFDPGMERGVIPDVKVIPLAGDYWVPGPVA
jgi:rare lipoprotein A